MEFYVKFNASIDGKLSIKKSLFTSCAIQGIFFLCALFSLLVMTIIFMIFIYILGE